MQKKQQADFERQVSADSEKLAGQIRNIEETMDALRKEALSRTSEKLLDFENTFDVDLKNRGDEIDNRLNVWKEGFDNKISKFQNAYENDRISIEEKYNDSIKERLAVLEKKSEEQIKKVAANVQTNQADIKEKIAELREGLKDFTGSYKAEIQIPIFPSS